ncbi:hypothetical protein FHE66_06335 [Georgenia sp. 311]|uniref:lipase family protein n=1 Tax=Georgenia sp. 311 TaxID=2585134 RepID=UPI001111E313|nr:lipase family protein [Georgenia sp. 311]TNC18537.1 hypothetical protein FHE66_06335 [Georgenia sp. 311]
MRPPLRRIRHLVGAAPAWLRLALAVVLVVLGVLTLLRPATSLGVLALVIGAGLLLQGLTELVTGRAGSWRAVATCVLWAAAGAVVLLLPGLTVRLLALTVGVGLVLDGAVRLVAAARRDTSTNDRVADGAFGVAGVVFGVLALVWPDITALAVSVVLGARLLMTGLALGWATLGARRSPAPRGGRRPRGRAVAAVLAVVVAVGAVAASAALREGSTVTDPFYAAPRDLPDDPGRLVRAEPFTRGVPPGGTGWRILYTTTRGDGSAAVASGLVVVPAEGEGPWPVIGWSHGTTGVAQHCAPSLAAEPFESGALLVLPEVLDRGWALVATDYLGLGTTGPHPYLIGPDTATASLDAVRAAAELEEADLGEQAVLWGHSQGGGAALWSGAVVDEYAPELDIAGVAALAPASDLRGLVGSLADAPGGSVIASFVAAAYTAEYDDVTYREYVRPGAEVIVRQMAQRCLASPGVLASVLTALAVSQEPTILAADPASGAFGERLAQNEPPATITAPLLLAQGGADSLITPQVQRGYVERLCAAGVGVDHRTYPGRDHLSLVAADSPLVPELLAWTADRLAGVPAPAGCPGS